MVKEKAWLQKKREVKRGREGLGSGGRKEGREEGRKKGRDEGRKGEKDIATWMGV